MEMVMGIFSWIMAHYMEVISYTTMVLSGTIGICLLIPGDVPEKQLQAVVDFLTKFSKK